MREVLQERMRVLANAIRMDEARADQMGRLAHEIRDSGDAETADGLASISREHRVSVMEMKANLAALLERYSTLYPDDL